MGDLVGTMLAMVNAYAYAFSMAICLSGGNGGQLGTVWLSAASLALGGSWPSGGVVLVAVN